MGSTEPKETVFLIFRSLGRPSSLSNALLFIIQGVQDSQPADPGDGPTEPHKFSPVQVIGSPEVMDDFRNRFSRNWMPFVVGQLVVLDDRAVFVFSFGGS